MAEVELTNYELNKQAYATIDPITEDYIINMFKQMEEWTEYTLNNDAYVGILCRERHDYTLVHTKTANFRKVIQETKEVLESRGEIVDIRYNSNSDYYECWVRERRTEAIEDIESSFEHYKWTPQVWMYVIFDATDWVIETE